MKRFSFSSLRVRLLLLVLFAIVPALVVTLYTGLEHHRIEATRAKEEALRVAQFVLSSQSQNIEAARQFLFTLAQLPQVRQRDVAACSLLFRDLLKQNTKYLNIGAVELDGNIFASAMPMTRLVNISDRSYFEQALKTRNFAIGEYQIGRIHGKPSVNFGYPVLNEAGEVKAVVFASLDLNWINELAAQVELPEDSTLTLIDRQGMILVRYPEPEKFIGKSMPEESLVKTIFARGEGVEEAVGFDGIDRLFGFTSLGQPSGAVYMSIGIPKRVAFAEADRMFIRNLTWLGLIAGLVLMAAWFIGNLFIMRPINSLLTVTKRLGDGDLNIRSEMAYERGEIGQLARAFDEMAESLEYREVERKRAEEALQRSEEEAKRLVQENAIMAEIGRIISSTLNIEEVYEGFAEEVRKLIPSDRLSITINNFEKNTFTIAYVSGTDVPGRRVGDAISLDGTTNKVIAQTRSSLLIQTEDRAELAARFPSLLPYLEAGLPSMLMIPLIYKYQVIGVLRFRSTRPNAYSEMDLRLAERVSAQIAGAIANAQLFVERKGAEEASRESEQRFKDLYDHAPLGYHEYDSDGRITNVNQTDLEMLGYTAEEMIGQFMWKFNVEEEIAREQILAKLAGILPPGRNLERTYRRKDGTTFPVLIEDRLILDEKGQIKGIRCTIQDITMLKQAEEKMANLQEQLRQSQRMEAIGRLAGGIAHDFNNLLTIIKGYGQIACHLLKEGDPLKANIEEILKATERATNLTRQVLAFSRRQILDMKVLNLNTILRNLDKMLRRGIGEDIQLVTLLAEDLGSVKTDPGQIEQVILNLAVNARDAMSNGGKLTIETSNIELDEDYARFHTGVKPGRYVMLSLSDTGVGMIPEVKERIFEPFFTTKENGKGTGLGLSTVYGIVKQSGGHIWVYSEPGQGTTFKIYLPRVEEEMDAVHPHDDAYILPKGSETILLVEDEDMLRSLITDILQNQGYKVLEAENGHGALRVAEEKAGEEIHLLLTDVVMPQMGGKQLADCLKTLRPDIKVLFISGYTDNAIVHHGVLKPGINFLQKPFSPVALAQKVREVLDR